MDITTIDPTATQAEIIAAGESECTDEDHQEMIYLTGCCDNCGQFLRDPH